MRAKESCDWCGCGFTLPLKRVSREWVCVDCLVELALETEGAEAFDRASAAD